MTKDKFTKKERCLHYIGMHARMYGAPADDESIEAIMDEYHSLSPAQTQIVLNSLKDNNEIAYWKGKFTEGWII